METAHSRDVEKKETISVTQIAHDLLWSIDVDKNLEYIKKNPPVLFIPVQVADPHGQKVKGTILQILAAAGDFNPRPLQEGETDYGLVERLRGCFPDCKKEEYDKQLKEWFREGHEEETAKRMVPYVEAIQTFFEETIDSKEIKQEMPPLVALLSLPATQTLRKALVPDPNHIATSGFLFDLQIFLDFYALWWMKKNHNEGSISSFDAIMIVVCAVLQARVQRGDLGVFKKGVGKVIFEKKLWPNRIDFSSMATDLIGLGHSFFFNFARTFKPALYDTSLASQGWGPTLKAFCQAKKSVVNLYRTRVPISLDEKSISYEPPSIIDRLPTVLKQHILSFFGINFDKKNLKYCGTPDVTFVCNFNFLYATQVAHNLLWNIDIDQNLKFIQEYPRILFIIVKVKDPHGQKIKGTILQIVAAAGDFNTRKLKMGETNYGLVERLRYCFPDLDEYFKQLKEWFCDEEDIEGINRMKPYVKAAETLYKKISDNKEIKNEMSFEALLNLPMAKSFREALKPDPKNVITSGLIFHLSIFIDVHRSLRNCFKDNLFAAILLLALQARVPRSDLSIFIGGIAHCMDRFPERTNFSGKDVDFFNLPYSFINNMGAVCPLQKEVNCWLQQKDFRSNAKSLYYSKKSMIELYSTSFLSLSLFSKDRATNLSLQLINNSKTETQMDLTAYENLVKKTAEAKVIDKQEESSKKTALYFALEEKQFAKAIILLKYGADAFIPVAKDDDTVFTLVLQMMNSGQFSKKEHFNEIVSIVGKKNYARRSSK